MIIPLRGKILVENIPAHRQTESGIWIAESVKEVPHRGKVISLGLPWRDKKGKEYPWDISEGDTVHFKRQWQQSQPTHYVLLRDDVFAFEHKTNGISAPRDMIIVKRIYTGKVENSTLIIPETYGVKENYEDYYGEVIAEGAESRFNLHKGDKILYHRNEGLSVKLPDGSEYFSLKPRAVMALI